jgi:hypothetical protein
MDGLKIASLTRLVGAVGTRRIALKSALGGAAASVSAARGLGETEAKNKKRKKCKKCQPLAADAPCTTNKQCCTNETNRACAVAENAGNDDKTCCGGLDAECGGFDAMDVPVAPFCCADFSCAFLGPTGPGTCQIGPF